MSTEDGLAEHLQKVEQRAYKTYKARLRASVKLGIREKAWNASLIGLSFSTAAVSIALLQDTDMYGQSGPLLLSLVSVGALIASLVVSGLNYSTRSQALYESARGLQKLAVEAEYLKARGMLEPKAITSLQKRVDVALETSENHATADYRAVAAGRRTIGIADVGDALLTWLPFLTLLVPVCGLIPLAVWAVHQIG